MKKLMWVGVVVAGGAMGCAQGPFDALETRDDPVESRRGEPRLVGELFSRPANLLPIGGRLDGAIGPATGLADTAEYIDFYSDQGWTSANVVVRGDTGSAMGILGISGDIEQLEVGEGNRTCQDDMMNPEGMGEGVMASVTGCANSGEPEDGWDYDAPADCTDLVISEPTAEAPEGTVATLSMLAHWSAETGGGAERTVKATLHLAE